MFSVRVWLQPARHSSAPAARLNSSVRPAKMRIKAVIVLLLTVLSSVSVANPKKTNECSGATRIGKGVSEPVLLSRIEPSFPKEVREKTIIGTPVIVEAIVTAKGEVTCTKILRSAGTELDASVLEAIKKWKYKPARKKGEAIAVYLTIVAHIDVR